ncbi:T9SS type A sorting domain-containing protein [Flavobacterium ranwuense]|uniref:T9SS type A sorting domain-containing protein n=1 Tax=Flavobacterium ranwuense TaxID=2541725 RepID=A0ABY2DMG3_9FLAO|nr:T9SS type A sorting domain-containing protein [Flavobacterium ranwuense]TDE26801.1 T9SS type A sorting domain-containing protein [Flavobacterium ranwuense]
MKNTTLQQFFEALSSKIICCFLSKNKISTLSSLKFKGRTLIDSRDVLGKITRVSLLSILCFFGFSTIVAQTTPTLPPQERCTSNDLEIVGARIITPACFECTSGTALFPLELSINNKTSSFRPTFAFWGTLEVTNGTVVTETYISGCNDVTGLPKNKITSVTFQDISYTCGTTLRLKNLYLAWTDASNVVNQTSGNSCTNLTTKLDSKGVLDISPKCGTPEPVDIQTPLVASDAHANVSCYGGSNGTVTLTFSGGIPPYSVSFNGGVFTTPENSPKTYSGLSAGSYTWTVKDSRSPTACMKSGSETIGGPLVGLALGACTKTDVSCSGGDGSVTAGAVSNAVGTVSYSWKNSSNAVVGTTSSVSTLAAGTYTLTVSDGCSSRTCSVTIGAPPAISTPAATVTQPTCSTATGTVTVTSLVSGITYTLTQAGILKYTAVSGVFSLVIPGTYALVATNGICSATGSIAVNSQPVTPSAPSLKITQPSLCGPATGSIEVCNPIIGYTYKLNGANPGVMAVANVPVIFSNLAAGSNPSVTATSPANCTSSPANCSSATATCAAPSQAAKTTEAVAPIETKTETAGFTTYPVPFKDQLTIRYDFDYKSDVKIEVFDSQGISVLSKSDTNSYLNKEVTLDLKLNRGRDQVYVVKVTTNRGSSIKKVISSE